MLSCFKLKLLLLHLCFYIYFINNNNNGERIKNRSKIVIIRLCTIYNYNRSIKKFNINNGSN